MATLQELETALMNAHNAGDSRAAEILAKEVISARALAGTPFEKYRAPSKVVDAPAPNGLERMGRGFKDFGAAGEQLSLRIRGLGSEADKLTKAEDAEIAEYEKGRGKDAGSFDAFRFAGQTLPTLPLAGGMGMATEAAVGKLVHPLARAGLSAVQGATQGALTYTPEGQSKVKQIALGGVSGGLTPFLSDAVSTVASKALQFGKSAAARFAANPDSIVAELEPVLAKQGMKWADLADEVKQGMLLQARRQMAIDGALDPDSLARKVEMDDVLGPNAGPTRGQVTRNSQEWTWERNTQKLPRIAGPNEEDLTDRFNRQLQILNEKVKALKSGTGTNAQNEYQAGASAQEAVKGKLAASKTVVDEMYEAWRGTGAMNAEVKPQKIAGALGEVLDVHGEEHIPSSVRKRLAEFGMIDGGKQTKLLTVQEAEKLRKLIGNNMDGKGTPKDRALTILQRSVDDAVGETAEAHPEMAKAARAAARGRFQMRDQGGAVTAIADGAEPDKLFQKFVLNGNVRDLQGLKATLNTGVMGDAPTPGMVGYEPAGAQAWKDLKGQVLEHAAKAGQAQGEGSFSGKAFQKALNEIGEERLKVIFDPKELAELQKVARVAYNVTAEPPLSSVNHSNTAATGVQYMRDAMRTVPALAEAATKVPLLGKMAAGAWQAGDEMAQKAEMRKRVARALMGDAFNPDQANQKYRRLAEVLSGRMSPYVGAAGVGGIEAETQ